MKRHWESRHKGETFPAHIYKNYQESVRVQHGSVGSARTHCYYLGSLEDKGTGSSYSFILIVKFLATIHIVDLDVASVNGTISSVS
jgi:hypothetical protein